MEFMWQVISVVLFLFLFVFWGYKGYKLEKKNILLNSLLKESCELNIDLFKFNYDLVDINKELIKNVEEHSNATEALSVAMDEKKSSRIISRLLTEIRKSSDEIFYNHCLELVSDIRNDKK